MEKMEKFLPFIPVRLLRMMGIDSGKSEGDKVLLGARRDLDVAFMCGGVGQSIGDVRDEKDPFASINQVLSYALPAIIKNNGAIEDFKEETFRAVFDVHAEDALASAISVCESFSKEGENGRHLAIALTYGTVALGVVGYQNRMSVISLSDVTRLGEVLQKKATLFSARILITGACASQIPGFETRYNHRLLGMIFRKSTGTEEKLYDVFDGDEVAVRNLKRKTKTLFERGISLFLHRQFAEARGCFIEVLKADRSDKAARHYLFLCDSNYNLDPAERETVRLYLGEI